MGALSNLKMTNQDLPSLRYNKLFIFVLQGGTRSATGSHPWPRPHLLLAMRFVNNKRILLNHFLASSLFRSLKQQSKARIRMMIIKLFKTLFMFIRTTVLGWFLKNWLPYPKAEDESWKYELNRKKLTLVEFCEKKKVGGGFTTASKLIQSVLGGQEVSNTRWTDCNLKSWQPKHHMGHKTVFWRDT